MRTQLRPAISLFLLLSAMTGLLYPWIVTGIAQAFLPTTAHGSLVLRDGKPIGSTLIGQAFAEPRYFWGRPSATTPYPNNGAASGGSNLGPSNPALVDAIKERIAALQAADPDNRRPIPADLVLASASGLDPHIGPAAAQYQVERVARARQIPPGAVQSLVDANTEGRQWGGFGEPRVNVLKLNLALDSLPDQAGKRQ